MHSLRLLVGCSLTAAFVLGCASVLIRPAYAAGPPSDWKVLDSFQLSVQVYSRKSGGDKPSTSAKEPKPIASYVLYAVLQPVLPFEECGCWKLYFASFSNLPEFKDSYRLWIDKKTGYTRKGSRFTVPNETPLPPTDSAVIVLNAPPGYPVELIPDIEAGTFPTKRADTTLEIASRTIDGLSERKAIICVNGKPEVEIRQRWLPGAKWWSEYERFYRGQRDLVARFIVPKAPPLRPRAQTPPTRNDLRSDPRLRVPITADLRRRPVQDLLDLISKKTGVELKMDAALAAACPYFGDNTMQNVPASKAMELLARDFLVEGRWEKNENSYLLFGKPKHQQPDSLAPFSLRRWLVVVFIVQLLALFLLVFVRFLRARRCSSQGQIPSGTSSDVEVRKTPTASAFALLELLVVLAIMTILLGLLPARGGKVAASSRRGSFDAHDR